MNDDALEKEALRINITGFAGRKVSDSIDELAYAMADNERYILSQEPQWLTKVPMTEDFIIIPASICPIPAI